MSNTPRASRPEEPRPPSPFGRASSRATAIAAAAASVAYALAALQPIDNPDTFGHLAQGRVIDEVGGPPRLDPFSFAPGHPAPWPNYEWLSDWIGFRVHALLGITGLHVLTVGLAALTAALAVWLAARRGGRGAGVGAAGMLTAALPAVRFRLLARPDLVSLPLALAYLHLAPEALDDGRPARWRIAALVALQIAWANLHGSHLLGLGVVAATTVAAWPDRQRMLRGALLTVMLAAVSTFTPFGPTLTADAIRHVFDPSMREVVSEWQPWSDALPLAWLLAPLGVAALTLAATRHFVRASTGVRAAALVTVALLVLAARSMRFVPLAMVVGVCALATLPWLEAAWRRREVAALFVVGGFAVGAFGTALSEERTRLGVGVDTRLVPAEACETLRRDFPEARVLGTMSTSWYVLYGAPSAKVLLDGRVPFWGAEHVARIHRALHEPDALGALLAETELDVVLLSMNAPDEQGAVRALAADPGFAVVHLDAGWVLYARRGGRYDEAIARNALTALRPGYDAYRILGASDADVARLEHDLDRLGDGPDARAFAAFHRALIRLRPLARAGGLAGLAPPDDDDDRRAARLAADELERTRARVESLQVVSVFAMLAALDACELDRAEALLDAARHEGPEVRETTFGAAELALRRGHPEQARALLDGVRGVPGAANDPWIAALEHELADPPRCR